MSELYGYIDESGIFQKSNNPNHKYFIISIILTKQPKELARVFKRSLIKAIKNDKQIVEMLKHNREVKGSELSEARKSKIYSDLNSTQIESEFGIIIVDTLKIDNNY